MFIPASVVGLKVAETVLSCHDRSSFGFINCVRLDLNALPLPLNNDYSILSYSILSHLVIF